MSAPDSRLRQRLSRFRQALSRCYFPQFVALADDIEQLLKEVP
jgi:hypothetical protein